MPQSDTRLVLTGCGLLLMFLFMLVPFWGVLMLFVIAGGLTLFHAAIAGGLYKEPLLAEFRRYGEEPRIYPPVNLLLAAGFSAFTLVLIVPLLLAQNSFFARLVPGVVFVVLAVIFFGAAAFVYRHPTLRTALPLWYAELLENASRQERRHIGWAWLRLPRLMRLRLNGDNKAFAVWADMVRLTVIYGAYDPDSPWHRWT